MGCIYKRKSWHCETCGGRRQRGCVAAKHTIRETESPIYWIKYTRAGKGYAESSGSERKKDAIALLQQREGDIVDGKPVTPKVGKLPFDEAAADLLADYRTNGKRSIVVVERRVRKHLTPYFTGWRMANISTPDVRKYILQPQTELTVLVRKARGDAPEERRPASNAEINRERALLKGMFSLALQAGKLLYRPHIPMLRENNVRTGFFEPDQYRAVVSHLPSEVRPIIEFAYITGWRIASEVLPLQWRQVDFAAGEVRLDPGTTKNRDGRTFPLTAELRRVLETQRGEHERLKKAGHIVPQVFFREVADGRGGEKLPQPIVSFNKAWQRACRLAGCPGRLPHDLRRTAVATSYAPAFRSAWPCR
jgi:integrase